MKTLEGMWQQILLQIYFSLHLLGTGISFLFLKAKSRKICSIPLASVDTEAPSRHGGVSTVLSCKHMRLALLHKTKEGKNGEEGSSSAGRLGWEPRRCTLFLLNSLVKAFEICSWKVLQKRLALLIKAFIPFLLGRRWNAAESVCCPDSCKDVGPWSSACYLPCFSAMLVSAFISAFWVEKFLWRLF